MMQRMKWIEKSQEQLALQQKRCRRIKFPILSKDTSPIAFFVIKINRRQYRKIQSKRKFCPRGQADLVGDKSLKKTQVKAKISSLK